MELIDILFEREQLLPYVLILFQRGDGLRRLFAIHLRVEGDEDHHDISIEPGVHVLIEHQHQSRRVAAKFVPGDVQIPDDGDTLKIGRDLFQCLFFRLLRGEADRVDPGFPVGHPMFSGCRHEANVGVTGGGTGQGEQEAQCDQAEQGREAPGPWKLAGRGAGIARRTVVGHGGAPLQEGVRETGYHMPNPDWLRIPSNPLRRYGGLGSVPCLPGKQRAKVFFLRFINRLSGEASHEFHPQYFIRLGRVLPGHCPEPDRPGLVLSLGSVGCTGRGRYCSVLRAGRANGVCHSVCFGRVWPGIVKERRDAGSVLSGERWGGHLGGHGSFACATVTDHGLAGDGDAGGQAWHHLECF